MHVEDMTDRQLFEALLARCGIEEEFSNSKPDESEAPPIPEGATEVLLQNTSNRGWGMFSVWTFDPDGKFLNLAHWE